MFEKVKKIIKENKEKIFVITCTLLYAVITFIIAIHHENWRDENQVWLLCKNLSLIDLIKQLKFEGHPFAWFFLNYFFIKLGASWKIVNVISWILMVVSVYLILKKSPFNKVAKIAIIINIPLMYQYVIIGRSYSLIVFLGILLCCIDKDRKQHPILYAIILGLLANTHIIVIGFVFIIGIEFYLYELFINRKNNSKEENKSLVIGLVILLSFGILLIMQLFGSIEFIGKNENSSGITDSLKTVLSKTIYVGKMILGNGDMIKSYLILLGIIIFLLVGLFEYKRQVVVFIVSLLYILFIELIRDGGNFHISMTIIVPLIYCLWGARIRTENKKRSSNAIEGLIILIAITSIPFIVDSYKCDYKLNYSSAYELAQYINENLDDNVVCVSLYDAHMSTMIPYLKTAKCWNIKTKEYFTYVTWNKERDKEMSNEELENNLKELAKDKEVYYINERIQNDSFKDYLKEKGELEFLYKTEDALKDEAYKVYKFHINE